MLEACCTINDFLRLTSVHKPTPRLPVLPFVLQSNTRYLPVGVRSPDQVPPPLANAGTNAITRESRQCIIKSSLPREESRVWSKGFQELRGERHGRALLWDIFVSIEMFRVVCVSAAKQCIPSTSRTGALQSTRRCISTTDRPLAKDPETTTRDITSEDDFESLTKPSWSVHELLSTYPAPKLSPETLTRLHKISALKSPPEDSDAFAQLKCEMEELVRLVEAVKLVDTTGVSSDGRILPADRGIDLTIPPSSEGTPAEEKDILRHAAKAADGFYIADTPSSGRRKKQG